MHETVEAVRAALGRFALVRPAARRLLLGVSGGPDSLALLLAAAELPVDVSVATVNHGLRPGSEDEAALVAAICRDLGLPHRTLDWRPPHPPRGNLMAAAREARYRLLAGEATRLCADAILVAHHADDQMETHLMARARGATGAALAGMRPWRDLEPGIVLIRPFLDLPKQALAEATARAGLAPVVDPTNTDARYERARIRAAMADRAHDAGAIRRAIDEAASLRRADDATVAAAIRLAADERRLTADDTGAVTFEPADDAALWPRILTAVGGGLHPPERVATERLRQVLRSGGRVATLAGCRIERDGNRLGFRREFGRVGPPGLDVEHEGRLFFDRRFTISGSRELAAARVEPLGRLGLGGPVHRALPVLLDGEGRLLAVHPALAGRFRDCPALSARPCVAWRIAADLPGRTGERLTAEPQIAANPLKAVGKDLAATYLR